MKRKLDLIFKSYKGGYTLINIIIDFRDFWEDRALYDGLMDFIILKLQGLGI